MIVDDIDIRQTEEVMTIGTEVADHTSRLEVSLRAGRRFGMDDVGFRKSQIKANGHRKGRLGRHS